jgi:hypothetical protein
MNHFLPTPFFLYFPHTTQKGENRMNLTDNYTEESKMIDEIELLNFMAGSAMIFSGFAITANDMKDKVAILQQKVSAFEQENIIEWTTLSVLSSKIGLTKDAIRKRLYNGDFEEGVDFKRDGNKIVVHQGAIGRLHRQRRSNNG